MASTQMKEQLKKDVRNLAYLQVDINVDNSGISSNSLNYSSTDKTIYSHPENLGTSQKNGIATLEPNYWILDGSQEIYDETSSYDNAQGYISNSLSNNNNVYENQPTIVITGNYPDTVIHGLTLSFDTINGEYPSEVEIKIYNGSDVILDKICNDIENPEYTVIFLNEEEVTGFTRIEIIYIQSLYPNRRARLTNFNIGYHLKFTNEEIVNAETEDKTTLINSEIPNRKFKFTISDQEQKFDVDNPEGLYKHFTQKYPLSYYWGYELDSGEIEWILGGKLKLDGNIEYSNKEVTFNATTILEDMTDIYDKDVYWYEVDQSLYENDYVGFIDKPLEAMATGVLNAAGIPADQYILDPVLGNIISDTRIPDMPLNEALQLIATAGCCTLYCNREGKIVIERIDHTIPNEKWDYDFMLSTPEATMQPQLKSLTIPVYDFSINQHNQVITTIEEVNVSGMNVGDSIIIAFEHDLALFDTREWDYDAFHMKIISFTGTSCRLQITKKVSSNIEKIDVDFLGYPMTKTEKIVTKQYNDTGEDITYQNDLITTELISNLHSQGKDIFDFIASWYMNRRIYSFSNRGDILKNTGENIAIETDFNSDLKGYLIENKISFDGAWKGESVFLKIDKLNNGDEQNVD